MDFSQAACPLLVRQDGAIRLREKIAVNAPTRLITHDGRFAIAHGVRQLVFLRIGRIPRANFLAQRGCVMSSCPGDVSSHSVLRFLADYAANKLHESGYDA